MHFIYRDELSPFVVHTQLFGHQVGIRWYGLAYLLSFALMYGFYRRSAARGDVPGLSVPDVDNLAMRVIIGVMVGGRVGYVVQHLPTLLHHPLFLIEIWKGGMAFFGGLAGVILAIWSFSWQYRISILRLHDVCALPAALGLAIGRIANFVNGELYGKHTDGSWGVIFPHTDTVTPLAPRHPSQLYESASHFLLFIILFVLFERWRGKVRPGVISFIFLIGYGILRLITDFWRDDDTYWGPLSDGQWFSLGVAVAGAITLFILLHWKDNSRPNKDRKRPVERRSKSGKAPAREKTSGAHGAAARP